jgi:3-dehydroquinate synthase
MVRELTGNLYEDNLARAVDSGHTFSQVLELKPGRRAKHGEAVSADILLSTVVARERGVISTGESHRILRIARALSGYPWMGSTSADTLWGSVIERTRHRGGRQRIPVPQGIGSCGFLNDLTFSELAIAVETARAVELEAEDRRIGAKTFVD